MARRFALVALGVSFLFALTAAAQEPSSPGPATTQTTAPAAEPTPSSPAGAPPQGPVQAAPDQPPSQGASGPAAPSTVPERPRETRGSGLRVHGASAKVPHRHVRGHGPVHRFPTNPNAPVVASPGFYRLENGVTRVAIEVSRKVEIVERRGPNQLAFLFRGAEVLEPVNSLPLVTEYFPTPVSRIHLLQLGPDVEMILDLRQPTEDTHEVLDTPRGIVLRVDFPAMASGPAANVEYTEPERPRANARERRGRASASGATQLRQSEGVH